LREKINARITALAATNDLLFKSDWQYAFLKDILISEFKPYDFAQVHWDGEDVQCPSQTATVLALIIHELTTNAAKHGALSKSDGRIDISWRNVDDRLTIQWVESGSLALSPPMRKGFGTKLLYSAIKACHGEVETSFPPTGIVCKFSLIMPETKRA
jgi:diguanylate cyclase